MNKAIEIKNTISQMKSSFQRLSSQIFSIKNEKDISLSFCIKNLQKMSLQALDLFNALEKQAICLQNQIEIVSRKNNKKKGNIK